MYAVTDCAGIDGFETFEEDVRGYLPSGSTDVDGAGGSAGGNQEEGRGGTCLGVTDSEDLWLGEEYVVIIRNHGRVKDVNVTLSNRVGIEMLKVDVLH